MGAVMVEERRYEEVERPGRPMPGFTVGLIAILALVAIVAFVVVLFAMEPWDTADPGTDGERAPTTVQRPPIPPEGELPEPR